jgi:competence protein ComEC
MVSFNTKSAPAFRTSLLFIIGILIGTLLESPMTLLIVGILLLALLLLSFRMSGEPALSPFLQGGTVVLLLLLGMTSIGIDRDCVPRIPEPAVGKVVELHGMVCEMTSSGQHRFLLETSHIRDGSVNVPWESRVLVQVRPSVRHESDQMEYGDRVALRGVLEEPSQERNPGEFSPRQFYTANGIPFVMNVREPPRLLERGGGAWLHRTILFPMRRFILRTIDSTVGGVEGELLKGILIGERGGIDPGTRRAFTVAGVAHVLAVSGSNVAVVAWFLLFLLGFARVSKVIRITILCIGLVGYMMIVGNQPPVVRATIMAFIVVGGGLLQVKADPFNSLGVAALIVLGFQPRQLFDVGFQLSFAAVFFILYLYPMFNARISLLTGTNLIMRGCRAALRVIAVSAAASIGTIPITATAFGQVSVIGLLANVIVIPLVGAGVVLGFFSLLFAPVSSVLLESYAQLNRIVLQLTLEVTEFASGLPGASIDAYRFSSLDAFPFYAGIFLFSHLSVMPVFRKLLILFLLLLNIAVIAPVVGKPQRVPLRVTFMDVGQGDAALLQFSDGRTMLVDAGPAWGTYDAGVLVVVPQLRRHGVEEIDLLVVSHPHGDHLGGVSAVLDAFPVKRVLDCGQHVQSEMYRTYVTTVRDEQAPWEFGRAGKILTEFENARIYVLHPQEHFIEHDTGRHLSNINNASVVLKVQYGNTSLLFCGDAEEEAEVAMVEAYGDFLRSTLLKVGHHGSITSSSIPFLESVRPSYAVISVGKANRYNHPSVTVLQRLSESTIHISRTDLEGALLFETDGTSFTPVSWR